MHIAFHRFDAQHVSETLPVFRQLVDTKLTQVLRAPPALAQLAGHSRKLAGLYNATRDVSASVWWALRLSGRAAAAMFALARASGQSLQLPLAGDPVTLAGEVDESQLHVGAWIDGFWAALAVCDMASLTLLACVTSQELRRSSSKADEYWYFLADAARAFALRSPLAEALLLQALRLTDAKSTSAADPDRVFDLDVPTMELFFAVLDGDPAALDRVAEKALGLHMRYWAASARCNDPEGLLSLPITALLAVARRMGLRPTITSDYIAPALVESSGPEPLILCPLCLTPLPQNALRCPGCLGDPRGDAPIDSNSAEYWSMPRKPCSHCATNLPVLAIVCPSCRQRQ